MYTDDEPSQQTILGSFSFFSFSDRPTTPTPPRGSSIRVRPKQVFFLSRLRSTTTKVEAERQKRWRIMRMLINLHKHYRNIHSGSAVFLRTNNRRHRSMVREGRWHEEDYLQQRFGQTTIAGLMSFRWGSWEGEWGNYKLPGLTIFLHGSRVLTSSSSSPPAGWVGAGRWTDPSCCLRGGDDVEKLVRRKVACWTCGWQTAMRKESEKILVWVWVLIEGGWYFFYGWCMINEFRANDLIVWMGWLVDGIRMSRQREATDVGMMFCFENGSKLGSMERFSQNCWWRIKIENLLQ